MTAGLSRALVDWAWGLDVGDAPAAVGAAVRRHLLDALGCAVAAARTGAAAPALEVAAMDADGPCRVPGTTLSLPAPAAALATGVLIHALDYDDTHAGGLVHASAPVVAAALAVAQDAGRRRTVPLRGQDRGVPRPASPAGTTPDGATVLNAIAVGLEVICRLAAAVPHGFHARGFHATSVCGTVAAALVASRLGGADQATAAHSMGIAVSAAAGSLAFLADGASTKQLHPGMAAQAGVTAARLAAAGATGPATALEGPHGLFTLYTGTTVVPDAVTADLGSRWECTRITIKPYPACQLVHASLDAVADAATGVDVADIHGVHLRIPPDAVAVVCEPAASKRRPRTAYDAKFSLQWTVAALLLGGAVTAETFTPDQLDRADLRALADRVTYEVHAPPAGTAAASAAGHATLSLADGGSRVGVVGSSRGAPGLPLDDDAVMAKLTANTGDADTARAMRDAVEHLPHAPGLDQLLDACTPASAPTTEDRRP